MKYDDFDSYLDRAVAEMDRRVKRAQFHRRLRVAARRALWFLAGTGIYHYAEMIWRWAR